VGADAGKPHVPDLGGGREVTRVCSAKCAGSGRNSSAIDCIIFACKRPAGG
jgi:hypothetical protein